MGKAAWGAAVIDDRAIGTTPESAQLRAPVRTRRFRSATRVHPADPLLFDARGDVIEGHDAGEDARDTARRRALAIADVTGICVAYAIVWMLDPPDVAMLDRLPLLAALPMWLLINVVLGLYDRDQNVIHKSSLDDVPKLLHSLTLGSLLLFLVSEPLLGFATRPSGTAVFIVAGFVLLPALRGVARATILRTFPPERVAIVGTGPTADMVARKLAAHPEYGMHVVGTIDKVADPSVPAVLGSPADVELICRLHRIDRVVIAFASVAPSEVADLIRTCKRLRLKITVVPRLHEVIGRRVEIDEVEGMTMLGMRTIGRSRTSLRLKRGIDIAGAGLGLLLIAPLMAAIAIAVKLTSRGPVLYRQERTGRGDRPFRMLKFRTMVEGADSLKTALLHLNEADGVMFKIADDPRITRFGRLLRRTSLDELPQLWNVLRGEMSLVGPRPLVPNEDDHCIGWHRTRLELTPGLTGPWQVAGRSKVPFEEMVKMDYLYVAEWSLWNDIRLLLRTLPVVVFAKGC